MRRILWWFAGTVTVVVLMLGGIDTTWSSLGASLYHLGTHPEDLARLVAEPELIPGAVEELLRAYSPVTIARVITEEAEIAGCPVQLKICVNAIIGPTPGPVPNGCSSSTTKVPYGGGR